MNEGILQSLFSFVNQILDLASEIYIYDDNGIRVSVLSFFVAISIFGIVLVALLNFVRQAPIDVIDHQKRESLHRKRVRESEARRKYRYNNGR